MAHWAACEALALGWGGSSAVAKVPRLFMSWKMFRDSARGTRSLGPPRIVSRAGGFDCQCRKAGSIRCVPITLTAPSRRMRSRKVVGLADEFGSGVAEPFFRYRSGSYGENRVEFLACRRDNETEYLDPLPLPGAATAWLAELGESAASSESIRDGRADCLERCCAHAGRRRPGETPKRIVRHVS
jgi:hypothetical protein